MQQQLSLEIAPGAPESPLIMVLLPASDAPVAVRLCCSAARVLPLLLALVLLSLVSAPAPAQEIRLALLADTHSTRGTRGDQPRFRTRLDQVIASVNASTVSLVLIAGDLTESNRDEEFSDFREQIRGLRAPVLYVPGNHDIGGKWTPAKPDSVTSAALRRYEEFLGASFYTKEVAGLRVIGVNSSILGSGTGRDLEQWAMLEQALGGDSPTTTVVLMHYPPFRDSADEPGGGYWSLEPEPRARFLRLLEKGNVKAVFSGHLHLPLINHYRSIPLLTAQPVSFGIPGDRQLTGWTLVTLSPEGDLHAEFKNLTP